MVWGRTRRRPHDRASALAWLASVVVSAGMQVPVAAEPQEAPASTPPDESRIERLERELAETRARLEELLRDRQRQDAEGPARPEVEARIDELERRVDILAGELETTLLGAATGARADQVQFGFGPAASKIYRTEEGLSIGGYGELLYTNPEATRDNGTRSGQKARLDLTRAILYFGYKFDEHFLLNTEIEYEHATTGGSGEVSVEFAYLDFLWREEVNLRGGLLLVPMGFLNELHEPVAFLSVNRPAVERTILPSTWREGGAGIFGEIGPVQYRTYVLNGFDAAGFTAGGLRGGRQKGSKALAEDLAWVGRADVTPVPGVLLGGSIYLGDSGQGLHDTAGRKLDVRVKIFEGHAAWRWRGVHARVLGTLARVGDVTGLNDALGLTGAKGVGRELHGYYVEVGYDVFSLLPLGEQSLTPFYRWEVVDTQREVPSGFTSGAANDAQVQTFGVAYQPNANLIFKVDFENWSNEAGTGVDQINVGGGFVF